MTRDIDAFKFGHELMCDRHPILLTPVEMKIISESLKCTLFHLGMHIESLSDSYEYGTMDDEEKEQYANMIVSAKHLQFMSGKFAVFAHDIKEKAEARYHIEV